MSARCPQFVCAALLAALLAPPALAKPAAGRGSAPAVAPTATGSKAKRPGDRATDATATSGRPRSPSPVAGGRSTPPPAAPDPAAKGHASQDMSKKTSTSTLEAETVPVTPNLAKKTGPKKARRAAAPERADSLAAALDPGPTQAPQAAGCAAALTSAPTLQFERTRATLREFSWSDMARFFETSLDEAEPEPIQVARADTLPADEAIRRSGLAAKTLEGVARARAVDLLTERELTRVAKALSGASPAAIGWLLRADSPTLRAHVWTWLATTPAGTCALARLDGAVIDTAIRDRSVAVEHGEDLVFRPLGDYALAARARVAAADPQAFDALLRGLWADAEVDPRVRALVAGMRVRRGHADSIELGLRDPTAAVRGATAAAAIDRDRARYEERVLDHAADDPADLVTELIVGELLGGASGVPHGPLAASRDRRVATALARWRGRGDPLAPLPTPEQPLRFATPKFEAAPSGPPPALIASTSPEPASAPALAPAPPAPAPVIAATQPATHVAPDPAPPAAVEAPAEVRPLAQAPAPARREPEAGPRLPSVLDDPADAAMRP